MPALLAESILSYLESSWGWAAGLAASIMGLTALAGMLNRQRKDEVALWLMGAQTEEGWAQSFNTLFDAVFGRRHLSLRCFKRSTLASLITVFVFWLLMGSAETIGPRLRADLDLGSVLVLGLFINVVADYISLLETRTLLAYMPRRWLAQAAVLVLDLLLSAAIIWLTIFVFLRSPLHNGEIESFAEILGVFSIFSVFFYSTFLTSVWTWSYIASTWLMRAAKSLRLADWLDVEHRPILILSNVVGLVTFLGALALSGVLSRDEDGLTAVDRRLCEVFRGPVCLEVANLTPSDRAKVHFLSVACEDGLTADCIAHARSVWSTDAKGALTLWQAACAGGDADGCGLVGVAFEHGIGVSTSNQRALHFYELGCENGSTVACYELGELFSGSEGVERDDVRATGLFRKACEDGIAIGCASLGVNYMFGFGVSADANRALELWQDSCSNGAWQGCANMATSYQTGKHVHESIAAAVDYFRQTCRLGHDYSCEQVEVLESSQNQ